MVKSATAQSLDKYDKYDGGMGVKGVLADARAISEAHSLRTDSMVRVCACVFGAVWKKQGPLHTLRVPGQVVK